MPLTVPEHLHAIEYYRQCDRVRREHVHTEVIDDQGFVLVHDPDKLQGWLWRVSGRAPVGGRRPKSSMVGGVVVVESVADVLTRGADITGRIGPLLVELLNHPDSAEQAENSADAPAK